MTVAEHCDFTDGQLETFRELAAKSEYWENAWNFYQEKSDEDLDFLTERQQSWLDKIYDDVFEKAKSAKNVMDSLF